ncbi:MAG: fumarylacetoacetate hydrolase family protein [Armatimonadota bacterium]|nr:fumarylacetoacetate hydrolase family protein [bacterium]
MKIARFLEDGTEKYGLIERDKVKAISGFPWEGLEVTGKEYSLESVKLLAPVQPQDVFAIGLNYRSHADETGMKYPTAPVIFIKASSSVIGPGDDIVLPKMAPNEVDYEAELVIVIGRTCKNVSEADALNYVLGYTCGNDVSARDCQLKLDAQWARGKSFDTFCPIGPWIETDIDPDNQPISLKLNGEVMQSSNTSDMIFNCSQIVSYCSQVATMKPGTIIMTGTPLGVGFARKEPVFLKAGDKVEVIIDGIGTLSNGVVK